MPKRVSPKRPAPSEAAVRVLRAQAVIAGDQNVVALCDIILTGHRTVRSFEGEEHLRSTAVWQGKFLRKPGCLREVQRILDQVLVPNSTE